MDLCMDLCMFEDEPNPTKVVCGKITSKQTVACFFSKTGHVASVPLEHRRTVISERNTTICLPKVFGEIRKTNKKRRIIVPHAMRALTHRLKSAPFGLAKSSNWWLIRRTILASLYARTSRMSMTFVPRRYCCVQNIYTNQVFQGRAACNHNGKVCSICAVIMDLRRKLKNV